MRNSSRQSTRRPPPTPTRWAANAMRWRRAPTRAWSSTSTRPMRGDGRSCGASRSISMTPPRRSSRAEGSTPPESCSTPTPPAPSTGPMCSGNGCRGAPPARRVECMSAARGGAAAMYYPPPSQDWSRPGRTWYPAGDRTVFPMWEEVTTAYHEGVPGHHLQQVSAMTAELTLTSYQRFRFNSGHGEGWALYAERLMDELGYHEQPDTRLGMLTGSAFRAARVVVDIGLHLELAIPADAPFHPGERWDFDLAREFIGDHVARGDPFVTSEVQRYLGMPGQAISYKVGEREWLDIRAEVRARQGAAFDLKSFHTHALGLGPMGLAQLRDELTQRAE